MVSGSAAAFMDAVGAFRAPFTHTVEVTSASVAGSGEAIAGSYLQPCLFPPFGSDGTFFFMGETVGWEDSLRSLHPSLPRVAQHFVTAVLCFYHSGSCCARKYPNEIFHLFLASSRQINCTLESRNKYEFEMLALYCFFFFSFIFLSQCFS